jgi:hypothetical protein
MEHLMNVDPDLTAMPKQAARHFLAERRRFRPRGRELARNITGCAVKAGARGMDIGITTVGPIDEVRHRLQQGLA